MTKKNRRPIGGVLHTYQKYDPVRLPGPNRPPPDVITPMMNQLLMHGSIRPMTPEEMARAIKLDPSQIGGLGPSLDMIRQLLLERKRRILERFETETVVHLAHTTFQRQAKKTDSVPNRFRNEYRRAIAEQQLYVLEQMWYLAEDDSGPFASHLVHLMQTLGDKYQIDELAAKYTFTGRESMTIPQAIAIKEELEKIDELLKQVDQAEQTAQIGYIDMEELAEFIEPQNMQALEEMQRTIENLVREMAEQQGLVSERGRFQLTPQAMRVFQGRLLSRIFSELQAGRSGRHQDNIVGDGVVELQKTRPWEFGDSLASMDITQSFTNAIIRQQSEAKAGDKELPPLRLDGRDLVVHETKNSPKSATVIIMDMSGSMRYDGQYINVKRMALAMDGLIRSEYPGDYLGFVEMCTFARVKRPGEVAALMPKPVTVYDPIVGMKIDMSREEISEHMIHQHFTNIQHALFQARTLLAAQDTPNKQVILITDGLPTAHFEGSMLFLLYPPNPVTEQATMREGMLCQRDGIVINMFLVSSWSQTEEDVRFAHRLAGNTGGRVFFPGGQDLDRFVVWDYIKRKREIIG
jgi:uncharacterized protein with von Willebrand factor type A (vWA) domain